VSVSGPSVLLYDANNNPIVVGGGMMSSALPVTIALDQPPLTVVIKTTPTYSAAGTVAVGALATDVVTLTSNAIRPARVRSVTITGTKSGAGYVTMSLVRRSTANALGVSVVVPAVPHDATSPAALSEVRAYSSNPTTGALIGLVRAESVMLPTSASSGDSTGAKWSFANPLGLLDANSVLAINLGGVTVNNGLLTFYVEWTEEA
jgi:hypothetical protein